MKKYLSTDFRKFILERLTNRKEKNNEDEIEEVEFDDEGGDPTEEEDFEFDPDGNSGEPEIDDDVIDELLNEYKKIKKRYDLYKFRGRKK